MISGKKKTQTKPHVSLENKAGKQLHGPAARALPPTGTAPGVSPRWGQGSARHLQLYHHEGSQRHRETVRLAPALQFMHGQTDKGLFHMQARERLPAHSAAAARNSRSLLLIDAALIRGVSLRLAGSSEAMAAPVPALSHVPSPQDTGRLWHRAGTSHRLGIPLGKDSVQGASLPS